MARRWDLLTYLRTFEPDELVRRGPGEYCTRTHDSLKISHGKWIWYSRGIGGRSALDYLVEVRGADFVKSVELLCGCPAPLSVRHTPPPARKKPFQLPQASVCPSAVIPYLQRRGIDTEILSECLNAGTLYESRRFQNCVFIGKDTAGHPRFACLRGTRENFKRDAPGSDKRFGFCLPASDSGCPRLAVAESPIDALSLATLVKRCGGNWRDSNYLSLGGTAPHAMLQFLRDHTQISQVSLCLDNDKAGLEGMERLEQAVRKDPDLSKQIRLIYHNPPPIEFGKDYNEFLVRHTRRENPGKSVPEKMTR